MIREIIEMWKCVFLGFIGFALPVVITAVGLLSLGYWVANLL